MVVRSIQTAARPPRKLFFIITALVLLIGGRTIASYIIDYEWWKELGQLQTWTTMLLYTMAPAAAAFLLAFGVLWAAHARGLKFGGSNMRRNRTVARVITLVLIVVSVLLAMINFADDWTLIRYVGARGVPADAAGWRDPVFGRPLTFYFFDLPFYSHLLGFVRILAIVSAIVFWLSARGAQLQSQFLHRTEAGLAFNLDDLRLSGAPESLFLRSIGVVLLLSLAIQFYLSRYHMLFEEHRFLVGMDFVNERVQLPLLWFSVGICIVVAALIWLRRIKLAIAVGILLLLPMIVPPIVSALYVRPNEISLEKPYIQRHIEATRSAYGLEARVKEVHFPARLEAPIDTEKNRPLLDNVRLWDWRAFHDTVTQLQALRQYYVFSNTDVDRYIIDGKLRQVLLSARELDVRQLADARSNWINPHFIYTHGYGLVLAEANRITPSGAPVFFIQDAPPVVKTPSLKLTRPELYFGEITHEPIFVRTGRPEFNYPSGNENVHSRYEGSGGFPVSGFGMRLATAVWQGNFNVLLTSYLTDESRMIIHRNVRERLQAMAGFLDWDTDPYIVLTAEGRMVWMVDGFTKSAAHPYSRMTDYGEYGTFNYIRNAVKATVDAYDGHVTLYVFDPSDPIIRVWQAIFPKLFRPASEMPADLRAHTRHPEPMFRVQSDIYRTFHMQDADAFYNKEDVWDIAKNVSGQSNKPEPMEPTYVVATLPGETAPEYLLLLPFTPRTKDNLIGLMAARCDAEHLGEIVVLQLSKQNLIYGPLQIEARIDSDQNISKDLSLWNQQGSQVLRGQMLVLPIDDTFLYVEPIYIQSSQARMPQLKKVVIAMGNTIIYRDTYEQALADLAGGPSQAKPAVQPTTTTTTVAPAAPPVAGGDARIEAIRAHLRRYRDLAAQGKWAEAGKELEAIESTVQK
jgi:uncharacterized membrane protein (UPF0182 family)